MPLFRSLVDGFHKYHRDLVVDRAVWSVFIVPSSTNLAFRARIVQRQEPVLVEALAADLAVEGFHEGIVRWLASPREAERCAVASHSWIEIPGDESPLLRRIVFDTP